jgi:hypothetical protein
MRSGNGSPAAVVVPDVCVDRKASELLTDKTTISSYSAPSPADEEDVRVVNMTPDCLMDKLCGGLAGLLTGYVPLAALWAGSPPPRKEAYEYS